MVFRVQERRITVLQGGNQSIGDESVAEGGQEDRGQDNEKYTGFLPFFLSPEHEKPGGNKCYDDRQGH